jgi:uncharacterized protein (DUF433 family)
VQFIILSYKYVVTLTINHIAVDPGMCGGKPYIAGKGISVQYIAALHNNEWTVSDLVENLDLTPGQIHAALSYYFDHKAEIDQDIQTTAALVREVGKPIDELRRRLEARRK